MMKKTIGLLLMLGFLISLLGCGASLEHPAPNTDSQLAITEEAENRAVSFIEPEVHLAEVDESLTKVNAVPNGEDYLTVCVDAFSEYYATELVKTWEHLNPGCHAQLIVIPQEPADGDPVVQKLRTEILAGQGPDVFIVDCPVYGLLEPKAFLFPTPDKSMRNDIFLPLDEYMKRATYMDVSKLNGVVMAAGQTSEGQMVLPLGYQFSLYAFDPEILPQEKVPTTIADLAALGGEHTTESVAKPFFANMLGNIADYDTETILLSEDGLFDLAQQYIELPDGILDHNLFGSGYLEYEFQENMAKVNGGCTLFGLPNVNGGVSATITKFAAINRNTDQPDNAWSLLDLLYSPQVMGGEGFPSGKTWTDNMGEKHDTPIGNLIMPGFASDFGGEGISVYLDMPFFQARNMNPSAWDNYNAVIERINIVRFNSTFENGLMDMSWQLLNSTWKENWSELDTMQAVEDAYAKLEMILAE